MIVLVIVIVIDFDFDFVIDFVPRPRGKVPSPRPSISEMTAPLDDTLEFDPAGPAAPPPRDAPGDDTEDCSTSGRGPAGVRRLSRFDVLDSLGQGGMGTVVRAWDPTMQREVAVKVPSGLERDPRFVAEARITGQLGHPNIVPVYELGETDDGLPFYAMKEIEGRSLRDVLTDLRSGGRHAPPWTLHRLLSDFVQVCNAVGYAHARGVLHRDLKPGNIMLGPFGEVFVVDWGLAGLIESEAPTGPDESVLRSLSGINTLTGAAVGTPGYMSPEQTGQTDHALDARSDVWSLGAILYELLTLQPACPGRTALARILEAVQGPPADPRVRAPELGISDEIAELCMSALATRPGDRPESALELGEGVTAHLDGRLKRERALALVERAAQAAEAASAQRLRAVGLRADASALLAEIPSHAPASDKLPGWTLEDEAEQLERSADRSQVELLQLARGALEEVPNLAEAHDLLADHYREQHREAEERRDSARADVLLLHLREHDRGRHRRYVEGLGALTLVTDPPARVDLYRYELRERRLVAMPRGPLGTTPLRALELKRGPWLLVLRAEGCAPVRYPLFIGREQHWDGVRPGGSKPHLIRLPRVGELGPDDVYVPAGWATSGEPDADVAMPRRRLWIDGFVMRRFPVTNREYLAFLHDLVHTGRQDLATRVQPRHRAGTQDHEGAAVYGRTDDGGFELVRDSDGDLWQPEWPVALVDWRSAVEYARWEAARTGEEWRLPWELEWEKAARGVDARRCPWGDFVDPSYACMRGATPRPLFAPVTDFPLDESPYGVRGLAGNVKDWCGDLWLDEGTPEQGGQPRPEASPDGQPGPRPLRGGHFAAVDTLLRSSMRVNTSSEARFERIGFRLARSFA